jgi:hypothetical protein
MKPRSGSTISRFHLWAIISWTLRSRRSKIYHSFSAVLAMEKRIQVSTHGRITIPKILRDLLKIPDGQPVIIRSVPGKRELVIELQPTIGDFRS